MDLQTRKLFFSEEFLKIQNEDVIISLEKVLKTKRSEMYLNPMTHSQLNADIDQSLLDSANNRVTDANQLVEEVKKWN